MRNTILITALTLLLFSCKENKSENTAIIENAAENTTSSFPVKRMGNSEAIVDGIYLEQIKNDKKLKEFHKSFMELQNDSRIMKNIYDDIINNSESYYTDAENRINGIQDSILKKEVLNLLQNSSDKFNLKIKKLNNLKTEVNLNYIKLYSFYDAFKVRKTLPEIEKYQKAHPLKTDSLNNFINKQNQLLIELKNLK